MARDGDVVARSVASTEVTSASDAAAAASARFAWSGRTERAFETRRRRVRKSRRHATEEAEIRRSVGARDRSDRGRRRKDDDDDARAARRIGRLRDGAFRIDARAPSRARGPSSSRTTRSPSPRRVVVDETSSSSSSSREAASRRRARATRTPSSLAREEVRSGTCGRSRRCSRALRARARSMRAAATRDLRARGMTDVAGVPSRRLEQFNFRDNVTLGLYKRKSGWS